jgi:hypothetical protein
LQAWRQRQLDFHEHERRRLEQLGIELGAIHERAKESARQIAAL